MKIATLILTTSLFHVSLAVYTTTVDVAEAEATPFTVSSGTYAEVSSGGTVSSQSKFDA